MSQLKWQVLVNDNNLAWLRQSRGSWPCVSRLDISICDRNMSQNMKLYYGCNKHTHEHVLQWRTSHKAHTPHSTFDCRSLEPNYVPSQNLMNHTTSRSTIVSSRLGKILLVTNKEIDEQDDRCWCNNIVR